MDDGSDTFRENDEFSWNNEANMLYIESPAGVGYSYTDEDQPEYNDKTSAEDNFRALEAWYAKFKDFNKHDLYIAGESYAGIYVPWLAK